MKSVPSGASVALRAALSLLLVAFGAPAVAQKQVGIVELAAPPLTHFHLRATLPVPPGTFLGTQGPKSFLVREFGGALVPAQVEIVSRYPAAWQGADVIEVLAKVRRDPSLAPGARIRYEVHEVNAPPASAPVVPNLPAVVHQLLANSGAMRLRATDALGNQYSCPLDLLGAFTPGPGNVAPGQVLRWGPNAVQVKLYGTFVPTAPGPMPGTFLPHLMGVHAYLTVHNGERQIGLDLRFNNGASGLNKTTALDDPLKEVFFRSIELVMPKAWYAFGRDAHSAYGPALFDKNGKNIFTIVRAPEGGLSHLMPTQAQFHRRMVLSPGLDTSLQDVAHVKHWIEDAGLAFCQPGQMPGGVPAYSWWNKSTARYFPQRHRLPELDHLNSQSIRNQQLGELQALQATLASGQPGAFPIVSPALGWAHPWGVSYGGMTGGSEIVLYEGLDTAWAASLPGYRSLELVHQMQTDRQPVALYNLNGEPTALEQWIIDVPGPDDYVPMFFYLTLKAGNDPMGFNQAPTHQQEFVSANNLAAPWCDALRQYEPNDMQHWIRYTRAPKVLAWLGNDALAKDDLRMQAELMRLSYHHLHNSEYGHVHGTGMLEDQLYVASHPGMGIDVGRGEGWGFDVACAAYSLASPQWRATVKPWFDKVAELLATGQSTCSGIIQAFVYEKVLEGKYRARQSFEQAILENAIKGMLETVFRGADPLRADALRTCLALSCASMTIFPAWSTEHQAPYTQIAVGPVDEDLPLYCATVPADGFSDDWVDDYQTWSSFAYGYELTHFPLFLVRADQMAGPGALLAELKAGGLDNLGNLAALLALAQQP